MYIPLFHEKILKRNVMRAKIVVIDADPETQFLLARVLPKGNYELLSSGQIASVIEIVEQACPDLLLLDEAAWCAEIRQRWAHLPIIVLLSATNERSLAPLLDQGADHCVVKPFSPGELAARIRALLRRTRDRSMFQAPAPEVLRSSDGYICLHASQHRVYVGGHQVSLTKTEFELLRYLMTHAGKILPHRAILQQVWGPEYGSEDNYLRVYIRQLRCKIEPFPARPRYLLAEVGVGYTFSASSTELRERDG
jgi:two-component system KDP operon response regulator KdpE